MEQQLQKVLKENENVLAMFQSYSNFYKNQIQDLENQLINSKIDLANSASDMIVSFLLKKINNLYCLIEKRKKPSSIQKEA